MVIHLATAFDQYYLQPFYAWLTSVVEHHCEQEIHIHAIATGISESDLQSINAFVNRAGNRIQFYTIDDVRIAEFVTMSTWTKTVYYRLYFPLLINSEIDRIIYLDADTLVLANLNELYTIDLEGHPVAAVYDNYVVTQPLLGIEQEGEYFNSGMLVIDTVNWRKENISEKTISYLLQFPERIKYVDQCGLNAVLYRNWKKLDGRFNLMYSLIPENASKAERAALLANTVVLHFTLQRPWHMLCKNRFRHLYHYYLQKSGLYRGSGISDFSIKKISAWCMIRLHEFYHDHPRIKKIWRTLKQS